MRHCAQRTRGLPHLREDLLLQIEQLLHDGQQTRMYRSRRRMRGWNRFGDIVKKTVPSEELVKMNQVGKLTPLAFIVHDIIYNSVADYNSLRVGVG